MSLTAVTFLLAFAVACGLAFVKHPIYGLLAYVATLFLDPSGHWWGIGTLEGIRWEFVAALVTLIAMFVHHRQLPKSPIFRSKVFWGFATFAAWIAIQSSWALDPESNSDLLDIWLKFLAVTVMICGCVDSWERFRLFLWSQVVGCGYLGWLAYSTYSGGRFQGFATNGLGEANFAALQLVIGLIVAASLFLSGGWRTRVALLAPAALIANGIVTTVSRSGFLAATASLLTFNVFSPKSRRVLVLSLSAVSAVAFLSLTTASYWSRMQTIKYEGADVTGVDTGGGRLDIARAQWQMFERYPLGCGAMCTTVLSPQYIPAQYLSTGGQRSSHNTFMTMLVDHGVPGAALYLLLLAWTCRTLFRAAKFNREAAARSAIDFPRAVLPGLAAVMVAITVGDLFVQYSKLEARVWFVSLLIVYVNLRAKDAAHARATLRADAESMRGSSAQHPVIAAVGTRAVP